jgi:hypothetical protein
MGGPHNLSRMKGSKDRKSTHTKKKEILLGTAEGYQARCRRDLQRHHEAMKDDPERLTTVFLVKICKCDCSRAEEEYEEDIL